MRALRRTSDTKAMEAQISLTSSRLQRTMHRFVTGFTYLTAVTHRQTMEGQGTDSGQFADCTSHTRVKCRGASSQGYGEDDVSSLLKKTSKWSFETIMDFLKGCLPWKDPRAREKPTSPKLMPTLSRIAEATFESVKESSTLPSLQIISNRRYLFLKRTIAGERFGGIRS